MSGSVRVAAPPERRRDRRGLLLALGVSALLRALALATVVASAAPPGYDEQAYLTRARGFAAAGAALLGGNAPDPRALADAYGGGTWPPLHPLLVAFGLGIGGVAGARAWIALLSVATTAVVYRLGARLGGPRAGLAAGLVHALYPSFVVFAPLLWSETTYLLLLALLAERLLAQLERGGARLGAWALSGALAGAALLTRAAALPLLAVVPALAWLGAAPRARWLAAAGVALAAALAVVAPWQAALAQREGRFVALSTATGLNLLVANNPWRHEAHGDRLPFLQQQAERRARATGTDTDSAARRLALAHIAARPLDFAASVGLQLRRMWTFDLFAARYLATVDYCPPLPVGLAAALVLLLLLAFVALVGLGVAGAEPRWLGTPGGIALGALGAASLLPPTLAVSNPRLGLPALLLLVPLAGRALATAKPLRWSAGARWAAAAVALLALANAATLGGRGRPLEERSSWYRELPDWTLRLLGAPPTTFDAFEVAPGPANPAGVRLELVRPGYRFVGARLDRGLTPDLDGTAVALGGPSGAGPERLEVRGAPAAGPLVATWSTAAAGTRAVELTTPELWWGGEQLGSGLRVRWVGARKARRVARGLEPWPPAAGATPR